MTRQADDGNAVADSQLWTAYAFGQQQILFDAVEPTIAVAQQELEQHPNSDAAQNVLDSALRARDTVQKEIDRLLVKAACAERMEAEHGLH